MWSANSPESVGESVGGEPLCRGEVGGERARRDIGALLPRGDPGREIGAPVPRSERLPSNKRSSRQKRAIALGEALGVLGTSGTKAKASALKGLSSETSKCGVDHTGARSTMLTPSCMVTERRAHQQTLG